MIELLVVIIIIGILAAIAIPVFLNQRKKAMGAATKANFRNVRTVIEVARTSTGANLLGITGNNCSDCVCRTVLVAPDVSDPAFAATACGISFDNAVNKLAAAWGGSPAEVRRLMTDGWGHPMAIDENEGETGRGCDIADSLRTMWQSPDLSYPVPLSAQAQVPCP